MIYHYAQLDSNNIVTSILETHSEIYGDSIIQIQGFLAHLIGYSYVNNEFVPNE